MAESSGHQNSSRESEDLFPHLNETFYAHQPTDYFRQRLFSLLLTTTKAEELEEVVRDGLGYGPVRMQFPADEEEDEEETKSFLDRFMILESEILLHHVTEVLFRLAVAHRGRPRCPWIVLSEMRDFARFKRTIEDEFANRSPSTLDISWAAVFLGTREPPTPNDEEKTREWREGWESISVILQKLARRFLHHSNIYNSAKHGFALSAGPAAFAMMPNGEGSGADP